MDSALIKLSIERLLEKVERLEQENLELIQRVNVLENVEHSESEKGEAVQKQNAMQNVLLDTKEVLKILGISYNTLQAIVRKKVLVPIRINQRRVRFTRKSLTNYINSLSERG